MINCSEHTVVGLSVDSISTSTMQFILNEIRSAKRFVQARKRVKGNTELSQIMGSFVDRVSKMINTHSLSPGEISHIMHELEDSPYPEDKNETIIELLDSKVMTETSTPTAPTSKQAASSVNKSTLIAWWNYFDDQQWATLKSDRSLFAKTEFVVHMSRTFGLVDPDEQTVKWLLALLFKLHYGAELPDALARFKQFLDLKLLFTAESQTQLRKANNLPPALRDYPKDTTYLPEAVQAAVSGAVNRDTHPDTVGLLKIANLIPMRKVSALLKSWSKEAIDAVVNSVAPSCKPKTEPASGSASMPNTEPVPATPKMEPREAKFCPECGFHLTGCKHEPDSVSPIVKHEAASASQIGSHAPAHDDVRSKLRINGRPMSALPAVVKKEGEMKEEKEEEDEEKPVPAKPVLDAHSQAAIDALRLRKDKKQKAAGTKADGSNADDDDDDDNDDDGPKGRGRKGTKRAPNVDPKTAPKSAKRHGTTKKPASAKHFIKRPAAAAADPLKRTGCMKCRGNGCSTCAALDFSGKRITRKKWLTLGLK